jgi:hypothetical protein
LFGYLILSIFTDLSKLIGQMKRLPRHKRELPSFGRIARLRLQQHLASRGSASKSNHWAFRWARRNAVVVGAVLDTMGLLRDDLDVSTSQVSLLQNVLSVEAFVLAEANAPSTLEGCYLFFDVPNACFVRSGKAVGQSFAARYKQHEKGSTKASSKFYRLFPDKSLA